MMGATSLLNVTTPRGTGADPRLTKRAKAVSASPRRRAKSALHEARQLVDKIENQAICAIIARVKRHSFRGRRCGRLGFGRFFTRARRPESRFRRSGARRGVPPECAGPLLRDVPQPRAKEPPGDVFNALDRRIADRGDRERETWEKVVRRLHAGTMPPQPARRPDAATYERFALGRARSRGGGAQSWPAGAASLESRRTRTRSAMLAVDVDVAARRRTIPPTVTTSRTSSACRRRCRSAI
jgi:hypothetical protein